MDKYEVAQILREMALLIELTDANPKKSIAYLRAANSIEALENFNELLEKNSLDEIYGIGKKISKMIQILINKNDLNYYRELKNKIPVAILELFKVGLNSKKILELYNNFKISSIDDLEKALKENKLEGIKGFTPYFIEKLKKRLQRHLIEGNVLLYPRALQVAEGMKVKLKDFTTKIETTGELRRKCEIISEISFLVSSKDSEKCHFLFLNHGFVQEVLQNKPSFVQVLLKQGIKASLHIIEEKDFALALLYTTASERHLKDLEKEASKHKTLLESGSYDFKNESNIYEFLDLNFIPPELREGYGEVTAAKKSDFSDLIEETDLKGTFHCHTIDSDGANTIIEMAHAAQKMGWEYIGITDHSKSSHQAHGLSEERLFSQIEYIKNLNKLLGPSFKVFSGIECDILKDGQLDFDEGVLKELDFVIVSIHSLFKQEQDVMTKRLIKAIENPYTTIVGHLTGRLLRIRDPYKLDVPKVIDACIANDKIIEINSYPSRLDMDWRFWIQAKERGLKCSINPDAHSIYELHNCQYGVNIARKGWVKKVNVINTLNLKEINKFLKGKKP